MFVESTTCAFVIYHTAIRLGALYSFGYEWLSTHSILIIGYLVDDWKGQALYLILHFQCISLCIITKHMYQSYCSLDILTSRLSLKKN